MKKSISWSNLEASGQSMMKHCMVHVVQGSDKDVANDIGDPDDIALGRSGHIYVLDGNHKKVHVLNGDAKYIANML